MLQTSYLGVLSRARTLSWDCASYAIPFKALLLDLTLVGREQADVDLDCTIHSLVQLLLGTDDGFRQYVYWKVQI